MRDPPSMGLAGLVGEYNSLGSDSGPAIDLDNDRLEVPLHIAG